MDTPLRELNQHEGFDVTFADAGDTNHPPSITARDLLGYDVVVGQRLNKHNGMSAWRQARTPFSRLVYELDDDIWTIGPENWQAYNLYGREDIRDAIEHSAQIADLITVTTPYLAGVMTEHTGNPNTAVLPNCVPGWVLDLPYVPRQRPAVGWVGGASHGTDVGIITSAIRRFCQRFPGWDLQLGGTDYRPTFKLGDRASYTQWIQVNTEPERYYASFDFDIGLAPLADNAFSRSKCVDSSMRVCTDRGVLEAGQLGPGMQVWHEGWRKIEAAEHDAPRAGFLITTDDGYQLRLTPEHRMMVDGVWTYARDIKPGSCMAMEREWAGPQEPVSVPWPADGRMSRAGGRFVSDPDAFLSASDGPRLAITPRWGRFLGAFAGDGSCGQSTALQISCDGQDQDWIDLLTSDFQAFGLNPTTEQVTMRDGTVLRRRGVRVASAHLLRVLTSIGVVRPRESGKPIRVPCVPEVIWRSPKAVIAEFLAGYFEADGHCTGHGVMVTSKTEQLIRDTQRLLLLFGITSAVRAHVYKAQNGFTGVYWQCDLRKAEARIFAKEIGFRSERKQARLAEIVDRPRSNAEHLIAWSRKVQTVEQCTVTPVDIQVEGSVFALAGFTSHNSPIKAIEYNARGIPVLASDVEPYRGYVKDGENGFLIRYEHEWLSRLSELASDDALRARMSAAAREAAREYTIERGWQQWADAYTALFPHAR